MQFDIITIFPEIFDSYFNEAMIKRAQDRQAVRLKIHNLRNWTTDKHRSVDDTPYGGGAGMVLKIEPLYQALRAIKAGTLLDKAKTLMGRAPVVKTVLLSAKGRPWTQALAGDWTKLDRVILICGRYEGVDERIKNFIDEEISIGDYVLTGGELGAMVLVDSITRLLPNVLGNEASAADESHSQPGRLEYPQYTKPAVFQAAGQAYAVPQVLLSGDHQAIEAWRRQNLGKQ